MEGVAKFEAVDSGRPFSSPGEFIQEILEIRNLLRELDLIGEGSDGIGYGNVALPLETGRILTTATGTGGKKILVEADLVCVEKIDFENFRLEYSGEKKPSSEVITHAVLLESLPEAKISIHIHSEALFEYLLEMEKNLIEGVDYGSRELVAILKKKGKEFFSGQAGFFVLKDHRGGIFLAGVSRQAVWDLLEELLDEITSCKDEVDPD